MSQVAHFSCDSALQPVRRAAARLVAAGVAERDQDRMSHGFDGHGTRSHWRVSWKTGREYLCANPTGVLIRRVPDAQDRAAIEDAWRDLIAEASA